MRFLKSKPNEYLVVGRNGHILNHGTAASVFLWPGSTWVAISSTKEEAAFEMTQESKDGIPLRFKGIVIYRVADPVAAASMFDFADGKGHEQIKALVGHVCLGELRAAASRMTMAECIEQRKTTLSETLSKALQRVVDGGDAPSRAWGVALDVVQVAQVFIVDNELRKKLEAQLRNELSSRSQRSEIRMQEEVRLAQILSDRKLQEAALEAEREKALVEQERLGLKQALEAKKVESEAELERLRLARRREALAEEEENRVIENRVEALKVEGAMKSMRAEQSLRLELLPVEQVPAIAQALAGVLAGANVSIYGEASPLVGALAPIVDLLANRLRGAMGARAAAAPDAPTES